jgi:hypothetical protein
MSPDREPERGWLKTTGPVTEKSDGHGLEPIVFLGPRGQGRERRSQDQLSRALIQMRDWCASGGRDTNRDRNHGREAGDGDTQHLSDELQAVHIESGETESCQLMSIRSQTSREIRWRYEKPITGIEQRRVRKYIGRIRRGLSLKRKCDRKAIKKDEVLTITF